MVEIIVSCIIFVNLTSKFLFRNHSKRKYRFRDDRSSYVELFGLQNKYQVSPWSVKLSSPRLPEWAFQLRSWRIRLNCPVKRVHGVPKDVFHFKNGKLYIAELKARQSYWAVYHSGFMCNFICFYILTVFFYLFFARRGRDCIHR